MSWAIMIARARNWEKDYRKDAEVLEALEFARPPSAPEPTSITLVPGTRFAATCTYYVDEHEATTLAHSLTGAFGIRMPGFVRSFEVSNGSVSARARASLIGVELTLLIPTMGMAENCRLISETKMVEQTTFQMVCDDPEEAPVKETEGVTP